MAGLMAQRSSRMLNKIRRELERRRKSLNVAKGGVVKKSAAAPPPPRLIPSVSGDGTATLKIANAPKEGVARKFSAAVPHPRVLIPGATATATKVSTPTTSAPIQPRSSSIGMTVKVRGSAKTLPTGERIFIMHAAIVVSDVEDGYLEVMYHGNYPRRGVVRIARDQVNTMPPPTK
ncbi:hypothetical protein QYE76_042456 [Lolium multiflorum]|uniref:Uncharacterized protein n=1 Tax=Lolium multiflorum TaxID=4521 RepID=A0AAD8TH81_LOLMU|nr:hypothetical protein QYE76_042456 [Lolium multiflorum]